MRTDLESHHAHTAFANDREWVAATDELTRQVQTLARSADAFNGTGACTLFYSLIGGSADGPGQPVVQTQG
jgi:hypothetical protein